MPAVSQKLSFASVLFCLSFFNGNNTVATQPQLAGSAEAGRSETKGFGGRRVEWGDPLTAARRGEGECRRIRFLSVFPPSVRSDPLASVWPPPRFICSRLPPPPSSPRPSLPLIWPTSRPRSPMACARPRACARLCVYLRGIISMFGVCQNKGLISFAKN